MDLAATGDRAVSALGVLVAGALTLVSPQALAAPRLAVARSSSATTCPDTATLTAKVEAVLGRPAITRPVDGSPEIGFDVEVVGEGEGFAATIRVNGSRQGRRVLHDDGPGCSGLGDALALTLAMLLDAHDPLDPPPAPVTSAPTAPTPTAPTSTPTSASSASSAPRGDDAVQVVPVAPWWTSTRLWLGGGVETGLTPGIEPMVTGGVWAHVVPWMLVGLDGFAVATSRTDLPPGSVKVSLAGLTARGCWLAVNRWRFSLHGCVVAAGGRFRAEGVDFKVTNAAHPVWASAGLGVLLKGSFGVSRFGWLARLDGLVSTREQRFQVTDVGTTGPVSRVGLSAVVGLSVSIW